MLDALARAGEIQHFRHSPETGQSPQLCAADLALEKGLFEFGDWIMWLDSDEYLFISIGDNSLSALFAEMNPCDAIGFCWRVFGDGRNTTWPGLQISTNFTSASRKMFPPNTQIKTLFQFSEKIQRLHLHRPVFEPSVTPEEAIFLHAGNAPLSPDFLHRKYGDGSPFHRVREVKSRYKLGQINHYIIRTHDVFQAKKTRGNGYYSVGMPDDRYTDSHYQKYNRNDVTDDRILLLLPALDVELARLVAIFAPNRPCTEN